MRVMGLDVGDKRIGVSVSDALYITAQPVKTINRTFAKEDAGQVEALGKELGAELIVIGLPKNMDGSVGFQAQRTMEFGQLLTDMGLKIEYFDERLTTSQARRILIEGGVRRENRKKVIDKVAAVKILEGYMSLNPKKI